MRSHTILCIKNGKMERFPSEEKREEKRALPIVERLKLKVYCKCRMPEGAQSMAYCPSCQEWFHKTCENTRQNSFRQIYEISMLQVLLARELLCHDNHLVAIHNNIHILFYCCFHFNDQC